MDAIFWGNTGRDVTNFAGSSSYSFQLFEVANKAWWLYCFFTGHFGGGLMQHVTVLVQMKT